MSIKKVLPLILVGLLAACGKSEAPKTEAPAAPAPAAAAPAPVADAAADGGKGAMPPKGGNPALQDDEIKAIVDFMVSKAE